jgi:hypothetical protein
MAEVVDEIILPKPLDNSNTLVFLLSLESAEGTFEKFHTYLKIYN